MSYKEVIEGLCRLSNYERHRIARALAASYSYDDLYEGDSVGYHLYICSVCNARVYDANIRSYFGLTKCIVSKCDNDICGSCIKEVYYILTDEGEIVFACPIHNPKHNSLFDMLCHQLKLQEYEALEQLIKN